jgi:hypothetical protein
VSDDMMKLTMEVLKFVSIPLVDGEGSSFKGR